MPGTGGDTEDELETVSVLGEFTDNGAEGI